MTTSGYSTLLPLSLPSTTPSLSEEGYGRSGMTRARRVVRIELLHDGPADTTHGHDRHYLQRERKNER